MAEMARRLAPSCLRSQARQRALASRQGWLSEAEHKNSWPVAEVCGETTPSGVQDALSRADGGANAVRDERRPSILPPRGDSHGVLSVDEPGFSKKAGLGRVARQYTGTVGKVENGQISVFLGYASRLGHALVDRERAVPAEWANHRERCRKVREPADRPLATSRCGARTSRREKKSAPQEANPLGAFKARRGLPSHCASPSGIGGWGGSSWPRRRPPVMSAAGRTGVAGTRPSPKMTIIRVGRHSLGPCLHKHFITTVVLVISFAPYAARGKAWAGSS